jgi:hypothetical protein
MLHCENAVLELPLTPYARVALRDGGLAQAVTWGAMQIPRKCRREVPRVRQGHCPVAAN